MDDKDYFRFIHDLFEFNDQQKVLDNAYYFNIQDIRYPEIRHKVRRARKLLVEIHAFCLMPNHYHLLLSEKVKGGISLFMRKLNGGYSRYFNNRHKRTGTLFERKYKSILVAGQAHFIHLPYYIHLNPLDLFAPEWREGRLKDRKKSLNFLNTYRWSSHLDYWGKENFPSLTSREFLLEIFGGEKGYQKKLSGYLKDLSFAGVRDMALE